VIPRATWVVPDGTPRERLDRLASQAFADVLPTKASAKKAVKRGEVLVDGEQGTSAQWIVAGQELCLLETVREPPPPYPLPLEIPVEDDAIAVVVKPPGLPTSGNFHRSLEHALIANLRPSPRPDALPWPRPAHRLDAPTSGLVAVGKTSSAHADLCAQFEARVVRKRYRAVVVGHLAGDGLVDLPIEGRPATTRWVAVSQTPCLKTGWVSTLDLEPLTGRTHQLRLHLASLGHPILGDRQHTGGELPLYRGKGLFLAATALSFEHPDDRGAVGVEIGEPSKYEGFRAREARRWARHHGDALPPLEGPWAPFHGEEE
jgi:tRNA pseudouridine65 synthase/23S rRNA pseudouridine1911/1915/1917 synthase